MHIRQDGHPEESFPGLWHRVFSGLNLLPEKGTLQSTVPAARLPELPGTSFRRGGRQNGMDCTYKAEEEGLQALES